jgi:hypothetical protein
MQVVMGWENTAPHLWRGWDNDFGDPRQFVPPGPQEARKASVADLFTTVGEVATYVYDFDAQWIHELLLTDVVAAKLSPILRRRHETEFKARWVAFLPRESAKKTFNVGDRSLPERHALFPRRIDA